MKTNPSAFLSHLIQYDLLPGDSIFTFNKTSKISAEIIDSTTAKGEEESKVNHVFKYIAHGLIVDIGLKIEPGYLAEYFQGNHDVYLIRRKDISNERRIRMAYEIMKMINSPYDGLQIIGFKLYSWTGWKWTKKVFQVPGLEVCSTAIALADKRARCSITKKMVEKTREISPDITHGKYTPDDLFDVAKANPEYFKIRKLA
jgi:hypothetical protein